MNIFIGGVLKSAFLLEMVGCFNIMTFDIFNVFLGVWIVHF